MRGPPDRAWGKLRLIGEASQGIEWHPLVDHCADVAACAEALLLQPTISGRLGLDPRDRTRIARLAALAFLHDLGKANWGFQNKRFRLPDGGYPQGIKPSGHVREVIPLFCSGLFDALSVALPVDEILTWGREEAVCGLLAASFSHHGTPFDPFAPPDLEARSSFPRLWKPSPDGYDPFSAAAELGAGVRQWFPAAFKARGSPLPDHPEFHHAFAGLVMLADWLGSDTRFFRYSREGDGDRMAFAGAQAEAALAAVGLSVAAKRDYVAAAGASFTSIFPMIPAANAMQEAAGRLDTGRLVILEAETGSGKTEAALWRFKQLFAAGAVDGLYFALPTRIAATQIHDRVCRAVATMFPQDDRPAVLLAIPGYLRVDDVAGRILPGFEVLWPDHPDEAEAHKRWVAENPKRFLAAQIAVGTIDQAMLSNLLVRHAHLRSTALLRHLLVVDEVHASDVYMTRLLASVLEVHVGAGGHALLMSATLGAAARRELLLGRRAEVPVPEDAAVRPYPSLSWAEAGKDVEMALPSSGYDKRVSTELAGEIDAPEQVARRALVAARAEAKVLVVRNTVRGAVAVQQALETAIEAPDSGPDDQALLFRCPEQGVATLHHGRFAREDRTLLDRAVEARIGRTRPDGGAVVVGTQTLEQSLDIDADLLITDLCPIDVLLQRLGRLHRHPGRRHPADFTEPRCVVLTPADRDLSPLLQRGRHGLGPSAEFRGVYPDLRVIEATWRLLDAHPVLAIPMMNRLLVEGATHPDNLDAVVKELGAEWQQHANTAAGRRSADISVAAHHTIARDRPFTETRLPGLDEQVRTRLGEDSRRIDFADTSGPLPIGPFGTSVRILTLPEHLCRGVPADAAVSLIEQGERSFRFVFGDRVFAYTPHGIQAER
jgi:CRISPR-associated endonuclease/helicase Cas3